QSESDTISKEKESKMLEFVESPAEIRESMEVFKRDFITYPKTTLKLLSRWQYWVYDPLHDTFGPSKFAGFKHMTFAHYEEATILKKQLKAEKKLAKSGVACFDGTYTREKIEKITGLKFKPDP